MVYTRTTRWGLAVAVASLCAILVARYVFLLDICGNRPVDVAAAFVESVQRKDYSLAQAYWRAGDVRNIEQNWRKEFADFCRDEFLCEKFDVVPMEKDKLERVLFKGKQRERILTFNLYMEMIRGRWYLRMDPFLAESRGAGSEQGTRREP
jgi:hypothetical protein